MAPILKWYQQNGKILHARFDMDDHKASREAANLCQQFSPDDEDEQVDDVQVSCFNCMKRRWLNSGLECIQLK